ncbi:GIY-YIG nuclease family protein [Ensifer sp. LCM 4579]|uniref:GIY-YIG nuclease family protein n=1 Tax=Ensifer sp. LCM 4579 TaxID=1848292 RepID=UPI0009F69F8D|nr:GIY-YIG nuclease family protein [Ensifer sp. LCM 4579]
MWYVYFLKLSNEDIYVGSTNDLKRRFVSHQNGYVTSTKPFRPVSLLSYVGVETETVARSLERYFKPMVGSWSSALRLYASRFTLLGRERRTSLQPSRRKLA